MEPNTSIDISKIADINQLKALAYDRLAIQQRTTNELNLLNARISELSTTQKQEEKRD